MKRILFFLLVFITVEAMSQTTEIPDTLVRLGGRKIIGYVRQVGMTDVAYAAPDKPDKMVRIEKKQLEKIIYKTGRIDIFNKPVFQAIEEGQWQAVLITDDPKEVEGLYNRGVISAKSASNVSSKKRATLSVSMKLQKLAANRKGSIVLITKKEYFGAYGDVPGCYMEGTVYGVEPLEEGTNVVNPDKEEQK